VNTNNLQNNFHFLLLGIAFIIFLFGVVMPLFYDYFIINKFFELYILIIYVFLFTGFTLPIGIVFIAKKEYQALKTISIIYLLIIVFSYLGLTISLIALPFFFIYGAYFNFSTFIKRSKSTSASV
jgi:hypothetical protein